MASITIPPLGKHLVFMGMTGTGKSELCTRMINASGDDIRIFSIDVDNSVELKGSKKCTTPTQVKFWFNFYKKIRYVPLKEFRNRDDWEELLEWLASTSSKKKPNPMIIHINEIYRLGYGNDFPKELPVIMATARKQKISMYIETQRPKSIPVPVLTEASRIYVFMLKRLEDRKYLAGYVGGNDTKEFLNMLSNQKKDYSFIEIEGDECEWRKCSPISLKK